MKAKLFLGMENGQKYLRAEGDNVTRNQVALTDEMITDGDNNTTVIKLKRDTNRRLVISGDELAWLFQEGIESEIKSFELKE